MKNARSGFTPKLIAAAVASCFVTQAALANPTNPTVVHGSAVFSHPAAHVLNVQTLTPQTIINWGGFSIAVGELTRFIQPSALAAVLNRVVGQDPSSILGALQSNGRVFLINPNGIVFGPSAQIDVAGLVASTLHLSNEDFLAGRLRFTEVPGAGALLNQGTIQAASGGTVYLVGPAVTNSGVIATPRGEVILAAGNSVELVNPGTPNLRVEIAAPDNQAVNLGQVIAESGRVGIFAGLIRNSGTVSADSAVAEGGRILLKATKNATLEPTSVLGASGVGGGRIEVLAGERVEVAGRLDASAPNGGDGGFIETSGKNRVIVSEGTQVTTAAPFGKTGVWLIDPNDFVIAAAGGDITGATLSSNLNSTSVTITSDQGAFAGAGDILVNEGVNWDSTNSLTLIARRNVTVNENVTNSGTGDIRFFAGWDGASPTAPAVLPGIGDIVINQKDVTTGGNIRFQAGRDIVLSSAVVSAGGPFEIGDREVRLLAGRNITIEKAPLGRRSSVAAITSDATSQSSGNASVILDSGNAIRVVSSDLGANAGVADSGNCATSDCTARVSLNSGEQGILLGNSQVIAKGVEQSVFARQANIEMTTSSGGAITIENVSSLLARGQQEDMQIDQPTAVIRLAASGELNIIGFSSLTAEGSDVGIFLAGAGGINVTNGSVIRADGTFFSPDNEGNARVELCGGVFSQGGCSTSSGGGAITLTDSSSIQAFGGGSDNGGSAFVTLLSGSTITVANSSISAQGGEGYNGGSANVTLESSGAITLTNSSISAQGGEGFYNNGGTAFVTLLSGDTITLAEGSSIHAFGGSGFSQGDASARLLALDGVTVDGSSVSASGRNAVVELRADNPEALVQVRNSSTVSANADGAEGAVHLRALSGGISVTDSAVNASVSNGPALVTLSAGSGGIGVSGGEGVAAEVIFGFGDAFVVLDASGGEGGSGGSITVSGSSIGAFASDTAALGMRAGGAISLTGSTIGADGGERAVLGLDAGGNIALSGGLVEAHSTWGPTLLGLRAGNDVTFGGNVTSNGTAGSLGWFSGLVPSFIPQQIGELIPSDASGIGVLAGNSIVGGTGVLHAHASQTIFLQAVNGVGTPVNPVRIQDGTEITGPNVLFQNTGSTAGDIAVSFVNGPVTIGDDVFGTFNNNNPNGTYFVRVENGNFELDAPFLPGPLGGPGAPLLAGQKVVAETPNGDIVIGPNGSIATFGSGFTTLIGRNVTQNGGSLSGLLIVLQATAGDVTMTQAGGYTLGLVQATGSVSVTSTAGAIVDGNAGINVIAPSASLSGSSGVGSLADPLETQVGSIALSASAGEIGVINHGNLTLSSLTFAGTNAAIYASTQFGASSGTLSLGNNVNVSGNLSLLADTGMTIDKNVSATGALVLDGGGGTLAVVPGTGATTVQSGGAMALAGANVALGSGSQTSPLDIVAGNGMAINAGTLAVTGGNGGSTFVRTSGGNMAIVTTGDVTVTGGSAGGFAHVLGSPDLSMSVGGTVQMNASDPSAPARIESASATTIHLAFPNLASGGYFVNGQEGVVADPALGTGFYADGQPAVPGVNLFVTYGSGATTPPTTTTPVEQAINQVIASTDQQTTIVETAAGEGTGAAPEEDDKKKKELPVCR